jgi:hypothetical protein
MGTSVSPWLLAVRDERLPSAGGVMRGGSGALLPPSSLSSCPPIPTPNAGAADTITVTVVPDTNALIRRGGASVRLLLERFKDCRATHSGACGVSDAAGSSAAPPLVGQAHIARHIIQRIMHPHFLSYKWQPMTWR